MDPERWRVIEDVLHAACDRDPARRDAWLAERCAGDASLLKEVRSLLALEERSARFLETPALARDPLRVGDYEIVRRLSSGGTAVVYEAVRGDPPETYAVKVLRGGILADERRQRRFQREVELLTRLRHPAIARIYEAGRTELDEHYFSMEFVHGAALDDYVQDRAPRLDERLGLFRALCEGVAYAHAHGVVHRDLKPDNVMVDEAGRPKILDFGIARLTDEDGLARSTTERMGEVMGTLRYMSPEQAHGRPSEIDSRTDVYSLGVMLYELITDRPPYDVSRVLPHEALRVICEQEPLRPSAVSYSLRGPLETVVLKALEKDPERRYATVRELGDDIAAVLAGRAIRARPPSAVQRARRTLQHHKLAAGVVASVVVALAVFSATVLFKNAELRSSNALIVAAEEAAREQADFATAESERARAALGFLSDALTAFDPDHGLGHDVPLHAVLDRASEQLAADTDDPPQVRAELRRVIARAYRSLGRDAEAEPHLRARLELLERHDFADALDLADAHEELARALGGLGDYEDALASFDAALSIHREAGSDDAILARLLFESGRIQARLGRRAEAGERLDEALAIGRASSGAAQEAAVEKLALMAESLAFRKDYAEAEKLVDEALELQRGDRGELHTATARLLAGKAQILIDADRHIEAEAPLTASLAIRDELLDKRHPERISTLNNLATLYVELGRYSRAEPMLIEVLDAWRELALTGHEDYAGTLASLGVVYTELGQYDKAVAIQREAVEVYDASAGNDPDIRAGHRANLARVLALNNELGEAETFAIEALDLRRAAFGERSTEVASSLSLLGELKLARGDFEASEAIFTEVLRLQEELLSPGDLALAYSTNSLGVVLEARGDVASAAELYRRSLEIGRAHLGESHPNTWRRMDNLARVLHARGETDEAAQLMTVVLQRVRAAHGPGSDVHPDVVRRGATLARALAELDRDSEALSRAETAATGAREAFANDAQELARVLLLLADLYLASDAPHRARPLLDECETWERAAQLDEPTAARVRELLARARTGSAPREAAGPVQGAPRQD